LLVYVVTHGRNSESQITFGVILPLTGANTLYGLEIQNAIELAREEINRSSGVLGRRLKVLYENDQGDPKIGVSAAQKLVFIDKVKIILGSWISGVVLAIALLLNRLK